MSLALRRYLPDVRAMLLIAIPLALAELGWMAMSVVDIIMVGRLPDSAVAIGSVSVANALFYSFAIFGIGLMSGLDTLVSQAFGAQDWPEARRALGAGLLLALCATPVLIAAVFWCAPLLGVIGVTEPVRTRAIEFTRILVWSLPMLLLYTTFRRYLQGLHCVRPIAFALVTANLVNLLGNWLLIFGHWGFPALGVRGSAFSTLSARVYLAGALLVAVRLRDPEAFRSGRPSLARVRALLRGALVRPRARPSVLSVAPPRRQQCPCSRATAAPGWWCACQDEPAPGTAPARAPCTTTRTRAGSCPSTWGRRSGH